MVAHKWLNETTDVVTNIKRHHAEHGASNYSRVSFYRPTSVTNYPNSHLWIDWFPENMHSNCVVRHKCLPQSLFSAVIRNPIFTEIIFSQSKHHTCNSWHNSNRIKFVSHHSLLDLASLYEQDLWLVFEAGRGSTFQLHKCAGNSRLQIH